MPLMHGKSKAAFSHNVATEMKAGKPMKQSLAIAYAAKKRKMAEGGRAEGPLTTKHRNALHTSSFALPAERKYPIHDIEHARNALSRVSANGTPEEKAKVHAAVHKKYPSLAKPMAEGGEVDDEMTGLDEGGEEAIGLEHDEVESMEHPTEGERMESDDPDKFCDGGMAEGGETPIPSSKDLLKKIFMARHKRPMPKK